jgi:mRNA interferase MazF
MQRFRRDDIIRAPFPYTDRSTRQHRPALIVSPGRIGEKGELLWVVMITRTDNRRWPEDIVLEPDVRTGLSAPSVIRPVKTATIEARRTESIGRVKASVMHAVDQVLRHNRGV